jgi:hypothetical protein
MKWISRLSDEQLQRIIQRLRRLLDLALRESRRRNQT